MTKLEIDTWQKRETVQLGQTAKNKWLMEGDQNTKFFCSMINQRRTKAHISQMVLSNGTTFDNMESVHLGAA